MRCPKCDSDRIAKNGRYYECRGCGFCGDRSEFRSQGRDGAFEALFDLRAERSRNPGQYYEEVRR